MQTSIRSIHVAALIVAVLLLCSAGADVRALGAKGQRIAGHMAHDLLTPEARAAIQQRTGSAALATLSPYLDQRTDQLEQDIPGSRPWHDDDAPICTTKSYPESCPQGTCASTQNVQHQRLLSDVHASKGKKQFTVFVLTHLVEDIHQPLHAVWDTSLVERLYGGQNEITVAKRLVQKYAPRAGEWQAGRIDLAKIQAWVEESTPLAKEVAYSQLLGFAWGADLEQTRIALSDEYLQQAGPVVEEQLATAGYRLAYMLNRAFGD